jgi:hypothetical protein
MMHDEEKNPGSDTNLNKHGIRKKVKEEPLADVIQSILKHPPTKDQDHKEQQLSVRVAIGAKNMGDIVAKIVKAVIVSAITAGVVALGPYLGGILGEILATLLKYGLLK